MRYTPSQQIASTAEQQNSHELKFSDNELDQPDSGSIEGFDNMSSIRQTVSAQSQSTGLASGFPGTDSDRGQYDDGSRTNSMKRTGQDSDSPSSALGQVSASDAMRLLPTTRQTPILSLPQEILVEIFCLVELHCNGNDMRFFRQRNHVNRRLRQIYFQRSTVAKLEVVTTFSLKLIVGEESVVHQKLEESLSNSLSIDAMRQTLDYAFLSNVSRIIIKMQDVERMTTWSLAQIARIAYQFPVRSIDDRSDSDTTEIRIQILIDSAHEAFDLDEIPSRGGIYIDHTIFFDMLLILGRMWRQQRLSLGSDEIWTEILRAPWVTSHSIYERSASCIERWGEPFSRCKRRECRRVRGTTCHSPLKSIREVIFAPIQAKWPGIRGWDRIWAETTSFQEQAHRISDRKQRETGRLA